jgi:hypothetical protein
MMKKKNGKRYGVLNIGAPYALLSGKWMKDKCGTEATPVVTSGRVDRIVAFMHGQLDATSVQCSGRIAFNAERPNEFLILRKFAKKNPSLMAGVLVANNSARVRRLSLRRDSGRSR